MTTLMLNRNSFQAHLRKNKDKYKLTKLFGNPAREQKVASTIKRQSTHARSAVRAYVKLSCQSKTIALFIIMIQIINSISPAKFQTLEEFTATTACKYKHIGASERLDDMYLRRNALWVSDSASYHEKV